MNFQNYCNQLAAEDDQSITVSNTSVIHFTNEKKKAFPIDPSIAIGFIEFLDQSYERCHEAWESKSSRKPNYTQYEEKSYREIFKVAAIEDRLNAISTLGGSQTRPLTEVISKLICYLADLPYEGINTNTHFDQVSVRKALSAGIDKLEQFTGGGAVSINISNEERFKHWMRREGIAESTITKYSKDTPNLIKRLIDATDPEFPGLFYAMDLNALEQLISKLKSIPEWNESNAKGNGMYSAGVSKYKEFLLHTNKLISLPKPFLLLAGISGTGKTRFVREQAKAHRGGDFSNHCLIPVRPDWHEPSDLLGYISRIGKDGARYVVTDLLRFVVTTWKDAVETASTTGLECKSSDAMTTHWLCLDEMNLAPVEQYFADYLSVLESREWKDGKYRCEPLLKAAVISQLDDDGKAALRKELGLGDADGGLWQYFTAIGVPLPPNLIVAGTVNMDETTHGFSRKVIDRAFTIDFGEFYPNEFAEYFGPSIQAKVLGFPVQSHVRESSDLQNVVADPDGSKSIAFLGAINGVLKFSPFELAYRALNELLLAVVCFKPKDDAELQAVWDDFLMSKVLPRIDGDAEKLSANADASLLTRLRDEIDKQFTIIGTATRPDLLREKIDGSVCLVDCRAKQKLAWMQTRLDTNGFTAFWP